MVRRQRELFRQELLEQMAGAFSLGRFGSSARPAVPDLLQTLHDPSVGIPEMATDAPQQIAPEALTP
jgi:hypothetical protein